MSVTKAITVRLDTEDYTGLEREARRLGLRPGTLIRVYVRAGLLAGRTPEEKDRRAGQAALQRLATLTADVPPLDAVEIVRQGRNDLAQRLDL